MDFFQHIDQQHELVDRTWQVIGKGPSFCNAPLTSSDAVSIGLNHVAGSIDLDYWHVFDVDVFDEYNEEIAEKVKYLVIPDVMNELYDIPLYKRRQHRRTKRDIQEIIANHSLVQVFEREGRLLSYTRSRKTLINLPQHEKVNSSKSRSVMNGSFSGSTVVNLLAMAGVKKIMLVGIDGGKRYSQSFSRYENTTRLDSGNANFDAQFGEIARIRNHYDVSIRHIDWPYPIEIYVGSEREQKLSTEVLSYSIQKNSSIDVIVKDLGLELEKKPQPNIDSLGGIESKTPFSYQRFAIPKLMNPHQVAVYIDSDMLVLGDIRELISYSRHGKRNANAATTDPGWKRAQQLSVLIIDGQKCGWCLEEISKDLDDGVITYSDLFNDDNVVGIDRTIPSDWNSLESYTPGRTRLIHFTDMHSQPWLSPSSGLAPIWCRYMIEYMEVLPEGIDILEDCISKGWVRPGLAVQARDRKENPVTIGLKRYCRDYFFCPPHIKRSIRLATNDSKYSVIIRFIGKRFFYIFVSIVSRIRYFFRTNKLSNYFIDILKYVKAALIQRL